MSNTIALLVTPDLAKKINGFEDIIPKLIRENLDFNTNWKVEIVEDYLPGAVIDFQKLYQATEKYKEKYKYSYVISLTDLPILSEEKVVAIDINKNNETILISVPSFGLLFSKTCIKKAILLAINEVKGWGDKHTLLTRRLFLKKWIYKKFIHKIEFYMDQTNTYHIRYLVKPSLVGKCQLILGMTMSNNPFNMMRSLTSSLALSFTTGAFGMFFTIMWQLSYMFSEFRLFILTLVSILGMVIWIILAHELWEPIFNNKNKYYSKLYNLTTFTTLFLSVLNYYISLFLLFLITCLIIIPPEFLGETLEIQGKASIFQYIDIAWLASSIATVAGAIGVGLTNDKLVKESTYGYRQQKRYNVINKNKQKSN